MPRPSSLPTPATTALLAAGAKAPILPQAPGKGTAARCAHDIRDELRKAHLIDGVEVHLDADCGACTASESRLRLRPRERIERALIALDEARRSGNDVLTEYDESLSQRISAEYRYESALRQAIENDRVQMVTNRS